MNWKSLITLSLLALPGLFADEYKIDGSHSKAGFAVKHLMVSTVRGDFSKVSGTIVYDEKNPAATKVNATIDVTAVNTNEPKRDEHLKGPDFFEVENHPKLTFTSTSVEPKGDDYVVTGDLSIKGTTKSVVLDLEFNGVHPDPWGGTRAGFSAETEISRKEFGVDFEIPMDGGGVVVGDKIKVLLEVEAVLQPALVEA